MPIQQILFKPKRGWVDFARDSNGSVAYREASHPENTFYELDGVISESHQSVVRLTKNPVEYGADISNHAIKQPLRVTIRGVITNSPFLKQLGNKVPGHAQYGSNVLTQASQTFTGKRIREAYASLIEMQNRRQPFTLFTGLLQYDNMVLTNVSTPNDITSKLDLTLVFEEVILPNLTDTSSVGYKPTLTTVEVDIIASAVAVGTLGIGIAGLAGGNVVGAIGGSQ